MATRRTARALPDPAMIAAVEDLARLVTDQRGDSARDEALISALGTLSNAVSTGGGRVVGELLKRVDGFLLPCLEPLRLTWDPLRALDCEASEPAWTQWLARLIATPTDAGQAAWAAVCISAAQATRDDHDGRPPAALWQAAAKQTPVVTPEALTGTGGFIDIFLETDPLVVAIENKLYESWHHREERKQWDTIALGTRERAKERPVGLLYLSIDEEPDRPAGWTFILWRDLAVALRQQLQRAVEPTRPSLNRALDLYPLAVTIAAIERHLLGLRLVDDLSWKHLPGLSELLAYLELSHA